MKRKKNPLNIDVEKLDLGGLTLPKIDEAAIKRMEENTKKMDAYREKYGNDWWEPYARSEGWIVDYDDDMKFVNEAILARSFITCRKYTRRRDQPIQFTAITQHEERMKELFGTDCDIFKIYDDMTIDIADVLIKDALKTGKWKELPDKLQDEYHKRAGDQ